MPTTATDLAHGRRGGRWLPAGYVPSNGPDAPRCQVCDAPLLAGQTDRHTACEPAAPDDELFPE